MAISDELRDLLGDPRSAAMLRERAERVLRTPITIFSEGDILGAWTPVIGPELARELLNTLAFSERLDKEEFALVGELALIAEDCYRAWSAEVDTDGAEWRQVQWSYTERNDHRSMVLHIGRWDGELVEVRTSAEGLSRLIRRLSQAQAEWTRKGGKIDSGELERASTLIDEALEMPEPDTSDSTAVRIEQELPESARTAAAELYWEAFGRLLRPALGRSEHGIAVLTEGLEPSRAIVALDGDELVGLVGLHYGGRAFTRLGARSLFRHLGVRAVPRLVPLLLLPARPPAGELRIDGIAVRGDRRGAGIGSLLLREAAGRARAVGVQVVRLEVVDTNPRARSLYEREGYVAVRTEKTPYLRRAMGFSAVTTMERRVG